MNGLWRKCSVCKKDIPLGGTYQKCSVSSCRKSVYCSVTCWDTHVPVMNHKSAWAEEEKAPLQAESQERIPRKIIVASKSSASSTGQSNQVPHDILIVASKLKAYVKARSGYNTSGNVLEALSRIVRRECDRAIDHARQEGRKTVMERDFTSSSS